MEYGAERSLRHLVFKNSLASLIRLAGVNDQRQSCGTGGRDMGAKAPLLRLGRSVLVEIIEPRLAQRDDFRMSGQPPFTRNAST